VHSTRTAHAHCTAHSSTQRRQRPAVHSSTQHTHTHRCWITCTAVSPSWPCGSRGRIYWASWPVRLLLLLSLLRAVVYCLLVLLLCMLLLLCVLLYTVECCCSWFLLLCVLVLPCSGASTEHPRHHHQAHPGHRPGVQLYLRRCVPPMLRYVLLELWPAVVMSCHVVVMACFMSCSSYVLL
jgi:hypothetical protein